jgi:hypothetical protein
MEKWIQLPKFIAYWRALVDIIKKLLYKQEKRKLLCHGTSVRVWKEIPSYGISVRRKSGQYFKTC